MLPRDAKVAVNSDLNPNPDPDCNSINTNPNANQNLITRYYCSDNYGCKKVPKIATLGIFTRQLKVWTLVIAPLT